MLFQIFDFTNVIETMEVLKTRISLHLALLKYAFKRQHTIILHCYYEQHTTEHLTHHISKFRNFADYNLFRFSIFDERTMLDRETFTHSLRVES